MTWGGDLAAGWRPHDDRLSPVRMDPEVRFGLPAIDGIRTEILWEHSESGETEEDIASEFDLPVASVRWAFAYETSARAAWASRRGRRMSVSISLDGHGGYVHEGGGLPIVMTVVGAAQSRAGLVVLWAGGWDGCPARQASSSTWALCRMIWSRRSQGSSPWTSARGLPCRRGLGRPPVRASRPGRRGQQAFSQV